MDNIYLEYVFEVSPLNPGNEILIAQLGELGFESFIETETGVSAYIQRKEAIPSPENQNIENYHQFIESIQILNNEAFNTNYEIQEIEQINWNSAWEKHFDPIEVDGKCMVRAPFHPKIEIAYDIVITPKMAFGTGHHETTFMMIKQLLKMDLTDKKTLDMGCGTGVLAILAEMRGAYPIDAIDIDPWSYTNTLENIATNHCKHISVYEGDATLLSHKNYDVIIANINRNILLQDISIYAQCLSEGGILLLSGFYEADIPLISETCNAQQLYFVSNFERNNWVSCKFEKR